MTFTEAVRELELRYPNSQKPVSPDELIDILKSDVVLVVERPGSWEGANMHEVLRCHGFFMNK